MSNKIELYRVGIIGEDTLLTMDAIFKARHRFIEHFIKEPEFIRVSPRAFNDLRALNERTNDLIYDKVMGMEIKLDYDLKDREWYVYIEEEKVFAL